MKSYYFGFDLGSHSTKGVLIGEDGSTLVSMSLEHDTVSLRQGWQEQDSGIWWEEFRHISKYILNKSGVNSLQINAVGITGFVPGLVMMDENNKPVRPSLMHTDIRAAVQLKNINKILDVPITHGFLLPKLLWVKDNEFEIYKKIHKILVPHSFIVQKLTGRFSCDVDTATVFGGVYNETAHGWSNELCNIFGIDKNILPDLYNADSVVGVISPWAAKQTGLTAGTPVIAGTGDTFAALLGCGAVSPGDLMIYLGTSGTQLFIDGKLCEIISGRHFGSGRAEFTGRIISCGESMEHFRKILGFTNWIIPDENALEILPGSDGLFIFPHLKQKSDDESSGSDLETIFGLDAGHSRWHVYRSLLEGIAYNLKTSFTAYESRVKRVILSGGGAKSRVFREIIRDVLGIEIYYNPSGNGATGIAMLAGYGIGGGAMHFSLEELSSSLAKKATVSKPNSKSVLEYRKNYTLYRSLQKNIEKLYSEQENKHE